MKFSINKTLYVIFTFLILLFLIFIFGTNIVPLKYLILLLAFFVLYDIGLFFLLFKKNKKKNIIGYVLGGLIIVLMGVLFYYLNITMGFFKGFGNNKYKEENYLVLTLEESGFDSINDLSNIGYTTNELSNIDKALEKLNSEIDIENIKYDNSTTMFEDLIDKKIDSVMIEESYLAILNEHNEYDNLFKTLYTVKITTEIEIKSEIDVTNSPFSVYISGIDSYGSIATVSRSDVNIVATVNPNTKQVLLVSVPRDYYVQLRGTTGYKDKLTHAGVYGVETSMGTLEDLLDTEINYYARVNFTSLEKIVDALGGVDVYSKYSFTSSQATGGTYYFSKGYNHMNGKQALSFSRERKALPGGDRSRGENQQAVIDGIIRKATSPAIITGYVKILNSLKGTFQTNMTDTDIQKLIKMQLDDMASWNITSYSLDGSDGSNYTYSYPSEKLYVMIPDEESVTEAKQMIDKVCAGEKLESSYDKEASDVNDPVYVEPKPEPKPEPEPEPEEPEIVGEIPVITFDNSTLIMIKGQVIDLLSGVVATDKDDGNLIPTITLENVPFTDTSILLEGTHTIVYTVTDKDNNTVTKTRTIIVKLDLNNDGIPDDDSGEFPINPPDKPEFPDDSDKDEHPVEPEFPPPVKE